MSHLECTAVGNFTNSAGAAFPLAESRRHATWSMQQPPNAVVVEPGGFNAVSCTSSSACIAVGSLSDTSQTTITLAEQWDGMTWSVQTTANPAVTPGTEASLGAVSCAAPTACMAVGGGLYGIPSLVEWWNGANWNIQSTPVGDAKLDAVSCVSDTSCTAVGGDSGGGIGQPLVEHWDGTGWTVEPTSPFTGFAPPLPGFGASLTGVSCTSDTACTAVGSVLENTDGLSLPQALVERWDGTSWSIQNTPTPPGAQGYELNAVSCTSATDCTAIGQSYGPNAAPPTLAEHWDGSAWTIEPTPGGQTLLTNVSCTAASACAAIAAPNIIKVWDGASWSIENLPGVAPGVTLNAVSCTSDGSCTVVGAANEEPFVERST